MKLKDLETPSKLRRFEEITKGWSTDKKYLIENDLRQLFLLRTATIEQLIHKQGEFEKMSELFSLGLPIAKPLDLKNDEKTVYSLVTWLEGEDAETVLTSLPAAHQYELGLEAGGILKKFIPLPHQRKQKRGKESLIGNSTGILLIIMLAS